MSQRKSGRSRRRFELYETPTWVVRDALVRHFPVRGLRVREPACGNGFMVRELKRCGATVKPSDKVRHRSLPTRLSPKFLKSDFLTEDASRWPGYLALDEMHDAVVTNPPYGVGGRLAVKFIERCLRFLDAKPIHGRFVALLLPVDFDSGKTRRHLFGDCPRFHAQIVLTERIEWFPRKPKPDGSKGNGPSANHAWFIWTALPRAPFPPSKLYAPVAPDLSDLIPAVGRR